MSDDEYIRSLEKQLDGLKGRLAVLTESDERLHALQRIAALCGGTGVIPIGGPETVVKWVETELRERDASESLIERIKKGELRWNGEEWVRPIHSFGPGSVVDVDNDAQLDWAAAILDAIRLRTNNDRFNGTDVRSVADGLRSLAQDVRDQNATKRDREARIEEAAQVALHAAAEALSEADCDAPEWWRDGWRAAIQALDSAGLLAKGGDE